tara:strand:- start:15 stop:989 length:975 start_codon:yes stop_codon:yes gene_type:complete
MKFDLAVSNIIVKAKAGKLSTILLPSGEHQIKINPSGTPVNDGRKCYILKETTKCVLIDVGFLGYQACGDALVTMVELGYDLSSKDDLKRAKSEREIISSKYQELIQNRPELFSVDKNQTSYNAEMANQLKKSLTQQKFKKYSGHDSTDLDSLASEVERFYANKKFGWIGSAEPEILVTKGENSVLVKCFSSKSMIKTWGNTSETAINVIFEKSGDSIEVCCGFTGNKAVLSGQGIFGAVITGGVSLVGNAASAAKDAKLVYETMQFIDDLMRDFFKESSVSNQASEVSIDIPSQIKKLSDLKDQGILTEEEFNAKKADLLSKM